MKPKSLPQTRRRSGSTPQPQAAAGRRTRTGGNGPVAVRDSDDERPAAATGRKRARSPAAAAAVAAAATVKNTRGAAAEGYDARGKRARLSAHDEPSAPAASWREFHPRPILAACPGALSSRHCSQ